MTCRSRCADAGANVPDIQRPGVIGTTTVRADGIPKVKGEFEYSSDMRMRGDAVGRDPAQRAPARGHLVA